MFYRITYNLILNLTYPILKFLGLFSNKLSLFIEGRKVVFDQLKSKGVNHGSWVWFHVASLGEFEQARPLISLYKKTFTEEKIYLLFSRHRVLKFKKTSKTQNVFVIYHGIRQKMSPNFLIFVRSKVPSL